MYTPEELRAHAEQLAKDLSLKEPVRYVLFTIGGTDVLLPRGADDPTPDNVLWFGGEPLDVSSKESSE